MKSNQELIKLTNKYVARNYGRYPIGLVRGKGTVVWDASGKKYIDFVAGLAVDNLGHCPPTVVNAIRKQAGNCYMSLTCTISNRNPNWRLNSLA